MFKTLASRSCAFLIDENGATGTEYAILLALLVSAVVLIGRGLGIDAGNVFSVLGSSTDANGGFNLSSDRLSLDRVAHQ